MAPIVEVPAEARPHPAAAGLLGRLAARWGRVVVLSGRPVAYLAAHLPDAGRTELFGLYGLERMKDRSLPPNTDAEAERWRGVVEQVAQAAENEAPPGVAVERKGLTATVHFRAAPDQAGWARTFAAEAGGRTGLVAHGGKMSVELRPPVAIDKGTVVRELGAGLGAVLFVGDDLGDLPAFVELDRMRTAGKSVLGVAVGGTETPTEVIEAADVVVDGPPGVVALLERLTDPSS